MLLRFLLRSSSAAATVAVVSSAGFAASVVVPTYVHQPLLPSSLLPNRHFASESKGKKSTSVADDPHSASASNTTITYDIDDVLELSRDPLPPTYGTPLDLAPNGRALFTFSESLAPPLTHKHACTYIPMSAGRLFNVPPFLTVSSSCTHHLPISAPFLFFSSRYFSSGSRDEEENFGTEPLPGFELSKGIVLPMKRRADEEGIYVDIDVRRFSKVEITASEKNSLYGIVTVRAENERETQTQVLAYAHDQDKGVYVQTEKTTATKKNGVLSLTIPKVKKK